MCPLESLGIAMATYTGQNYGAGKPERIWMGVKVSALMMIIYWAFTFCVLMLGARYVCLAFCGSVRTGNLEGHGVVPAYFRVLLPGFGTALYSAIYHSGSGIYQSCYAFRSFRNDSTCAGKSLCSARFRLSCGLLR
mgnify:CR=1 FL=1